MTVRILTGHVLDRLNDLPDESVHMVLTSPPYFGLRAYGTEPQTWGGEECAHEWGDPGVDRETGRRDGHRRAEAGVFAEGQWRPEWAGGADKPHAKASSGAFCLRCGAWRGELGQEPTVALFVAHLVAVFAAVRRVMRKDAILVVNLGDSYAGSWGNQGRKESRGTQRPINGPILQPLKGQYPDHASNTGAIRGDGLKPKDLMLVPDRFRLAMQSDGWYVRSKMVWAKRSAMPESVTDRPSTSLEDVIMFTKAAKYFWDPIAVARRGESTKDGIWLDSRKQGVQPMRNGQTAHGLLPRQGVEGRTASGLRDLRQGESGGAPDATGGAGAQPRISGEVLPNGTRTGDSGEARHIGEGKATPGGIPPTTGRTGAGEGIHPIGCGQGGEQEALREESRSLLGTASSLSSDGTVEGAAAPVLGDRAGQGRASAPEPEATSGAHCGKDGPELAHLGAMGANQSALWAPMRLLPEGGGPADAGSRRPAESGRNLHDGQHHPGVSVVQLPEEHQDRAGVDGGEWDGLAHARNEDRGTAGASRNLRNGDFLFDSLGLILDEDGDETPEPQPKARKADTRRGEGAPSSQARISGGLAVGMATHMGNDVNAGPPFPPQGLILDEDGDPLALDVNPAGYPGAHFATWPPKLVRPLILAGTSQAGACAACGSPWVRVVEPTGHVNRREPAHVPGNSPTKTDSTGWGPTSRGTDRWSPSCKCGTDDTQPCRVLDIFAGAGTTLLVADQLGRDAIGIDLQTDYVSMAVTRVHDDAPLFAAVTVETERQLPLTERTS